MVQKNYKGNFCSMRPQYFFQFSFPRFRVKVVTETPQLRVVSSPIRFMLNGIDQLFHSVADAWRHEFVMTILGLAQGATISLFINKLDIFSKRFNRIWRHHTTAGNKYSQLEAISPIFQNYIPVHPLHPRASERHHSLPIPY